MAIARTILKDPQILFCDEATSALDTETEQHILESFDKIKNNRTICMIAHRLSTVTDCDIIYVLKDGKVVEQGKFIWYYMFGQGVCLFFRMSWYNIWKFR